MPHSSRLSTSDFEAVLQTVLRLNACDNVAALASQGVQALLDLIPADALCLQLLRSNGEPILQIVSQGWPYTREQVAFYTENVAQHPMVQYYAVHGGGCAIRMSDVITQAGLEQNPIYQFCMRPHGMHYSLGYLDTVGMGRQLGISFDRKTNDFTVREKRLLEAVAPHLGQVMARLGLLEGRKRPWREPSTRDWLAGELGVSNREADILIHLSEGRRDHEIADLLKISPLTVKKHLSNIYQKLGLSNRYAVGMKVREILAR